MAASDNRPQLQSVLNRLMALPAGILGRFNTSGAYPLLVELLDQSISWVEDQATTSFNAMWLPPFGVDYASGADYGIVQGSSPGLTYASLPDGTKVGFEKYDGNGTNKLTLRKRPILDLALVQVRLPVLGYTRVYKRDEVILYNRQGILEVFTYKLAVEQSLIQTVDQQSWGNLFPPLPQAVQVAYCWGFPGYDPESTAVDRYTGVPINGPATTLDAGHSWTAGDQRDTELSNWLANLQEAAIINTVLMFLAESAGLGRGIFQSVGFDGYSRTLAGQPFAAEVQSMIERRDQIMNRRGRRFTMSTLG